MHLSAVHVKGGQISGVLNMSSADPLSVDNTALTAVVGGRSYPVKIAPIASLKRATMIVVDTSGSMGESGMATVRSAVGSFLDAVPPDVAVGLTSFSDRPHVDVAPTTDRKRVRLAVNALRSDGETTLYDGIVTGAAALNGFDSRTLVLLSDGGDTRSKKATAASARQAIAKASIGVAVVGFRTEDSDNSILSGFATAGAGSVAAAENATQVAAAFTSAARALSAQVAFQVSPGSEVGSADRLVLTGSAGGKIFQLDSPISLRSVDLPSSEDRRRAPCPSSSGSLFPRTTARCSSSGLGALGLGLLGLALALAAPGLRSQRSKRVESIEQYVSGSYRTTMTMPLPPVPSALSQGLVRMGDKFMEGRDSTTKTMRLIVPRRPSAACW